MPTRGAFCRVDRSTRDRSLGHVPAGAQGGQGGSGRGVEGELVTPCYGLRHLLARGAVASGRLLPPFLPLAFHPVHELRETGVAPKTG